MQEAEGRGALRALRVVAALVALGTLKAAWTMGFDRPSFDAAFPGLGPGEFRALFVLVAINFASAAGTLLRSRVAAVVLLAAGVATIVADVVIGGPAFHLASAVMLMAVVAPLAWRARHHLR